MLTVRRELKEASDLGEFGAQALLAALEARGVAPLLSVRTIGRILDRRGRWMAAAGSDAPHRRRAGTCPRWLLPRPSWTASTSSRGW